MAGRHVLALPAWLRGIAADSFKKYLILGLCLLGLGLYATEQRHAETADLAEKQVLFFFNPLCPHCQQQKEFNLYLKGKYPELQWAEYDTSNPEIAKLLTKFAERSGRSQPPLAVPLTIIGPYVISGFESAATTGVTLEKAILAYLNDYPALFDAKAQAGPPPLSGTVPFLGEIRYADYSLLSLAVILGLVDGFNPCAMWVLVYLISLILTLKERKKIWLLAGTFVAASGILYFLFMTAWLNVFIFLGYIRLLTLIIGLIAIGVGILNLREYLQTKGNLACAIGDAESKKETMGKIERIVQAPLTLFTLCNIIVLAFVVNSIEFACSAALPAIFTHTLALSQLATLQYYGYILLYDFFFMLDDLIIFSLAILALNTGIGDRYAKYCKIIGGIVLLILGVIMVFRPELLR